MNSSLPSVPLPYKDRRTGLRVFGALTILFGSLAASMVPLMVFGNAMAPATDGPISPTVQAAVIYGGYALVLIGLGVGSIFARRWARALLLILSWSVFMMGIVLAITVVVLLPDAIRLGQPTGFQELPPEALEGILILSVMLMGVLLVLIPGIWVIFYGSRHVKATCEALHPQGDWTDYCPLPVLAVSLWLAAAIPMILMTPLSYGPVFPFFGEFLTGKTGLAAYLVMAFFWALAARWVYLLDLRGWWLVILGFALFMASNFLTYSRQELSTLYALLGFPAEQVRQLRNLPILSGDSVKWSVSSMTVPIVFYLFAIRRYFRHME